MDALDPEKLSRSTGQSLSAATAHQRNIVLEKMFAYLGRPPNSTTLYTMLETMLPDPNQPLSHKDRIFSMFTPSRNTCVEGYKWMSNKV